MVALVGAGRSVRKGSVAEQAGGEDRGLGSPFQAELGEQAGDVVLDRLLGQEQPLPDLPVGHPLGDAAQDLALLLGQRGQLSGGPDPSRTRCSTRAISAGSSSDWPAPPAGCRRPDRCRGSA